MTASASDIDGERTRVRLSIRQLAALITSIVSAAAFLGGLLLHLNMQLSELRTTIALFRQSSEYRLEAMEKRIAQAEETVRAIQRMGRDE